MDQFMHVLNLKLCLNYKILDYPYMENNLKDF